MIIKKIIEELESTSKPVAKLLRNGDNFKVVAIGFNKNSILEDHKTEIPAKLVVWKGKVTYNEGDRTEILNQYDEVEIPANKIHSVVALEDSLCMVIKGGR